MKIRIPFRNAYLIKNKGLMVGEGTESEGLWNNGFGFRRINILGIGFVIASDAIPTSNTKGIK